MHLIRRARRTLRRRIEASQAFNGVADEFDPNRLGIGGGKHVHNAAADGKGAVLVDWVLARKACIDEQVGQSLRLDFRAGRSSTEARSRRSCELTRGNSAAPTPRSIGRSRPPQRAVLGRAPPPRGSAASCLVWIDLNRGKRKHRLLNRRGRRALERA